MMDKADSCSVDATERRPSNHSETVRDRSKSPLSDSKPALGDGKDNKDSKTRRKLRTVRTKAKRRAKDLLGVPQSPHSSDEDLDEDESDLQTVSNDPAFHPTHVERRLDIKHTKAEGGIAKAKAALDIATTTIAHPRKTAIHRIKRSAANKIGTSAKGPSAGQNADLAFLEYERELARSGSSRSSSSFLSETDSEDGQAITAKSRLLDEQRDSVRAAWITSRTRRVRVVPKGHLHYPYKKSFEERDEEGNLIQTHWLNWVGNFLLYFTQDFSTQYVDDFEDLPFDLDTLRAHVERLFIASGPWQTWLMDLRSVYRWEDPKRTGKLFAIYVFFWYINHVMAYFWGFILYKVIRNKFYPSSIQNLRAAARRAVNQETVAFQIGEMIDRHGRDEWIDPFLEQAGPYAQVQINDLANILEVLYNFYSWKSPYKTAYSLFFFFICLLTALFADMYYCMKIVFFISGGSFFLCWPIASLYPRYRLLVSPIKWVLWDIPTHAEWSFQYLRRQAQVTREAMIRKHVDELHEAELDHPPSEHYQGHYEVSHPSIEVDGKEAAEESSDDSGYETAGSTSSILSGKDIISFRASWDNLPGRLIIYPSGVRFVRSLMPKEVWRLSFLDLAEMWKVGGNKGKKLRIGGLHGKGQLCLKATNGHIWRLEPVRERDEAFNCIIGFSGLQWQSLQTVPETKKKHDDDSDE